MKKRMNLFKCALSLMAITLSFGITSCTNDKLGNSEVNASVEKEYVLCGGFSEDSTRMYLDKNKQHFNWEEGDVLCLYDSNGTFYTSVKVQASDIQSDGKVIIRARLSQVPKYITMSGVDGKYATDGAELNINEGAIASYSVDSNGKMDSKAPILARSEVKITEANGTSRCSFSLQHNIAYVYVKYIKENEEPLQKVYVKTIGGKVELNVKNTTLEQTENSTQVAGSVNVGSVIAVIPGTKLVIAKDENSTPYVNTTVTASMYTVTRGEENETVYVAGYDGEYAKIWKNGVATINEADSIYFEGDTLNADLSTATSVFVYNNKVYSAGNSFTVKMMPSYYTAIVWEDGEILQRLNNPKSDSPVYIAKSVFVSNNNVYSIKYDVGPAFEVYPIRGMCYITKNGVELCPENYSGKDRAVINSLYVDGDDVYYTGKFGLDDQWDQFNKPKECAVYWRNEERIQLAEGDNCDADGKSIYVSNGDVYVVGSNNKKEATLWKNGNVLYKYGANLNANAVFVSGGDVYVAGDKQVWKNSELLYTITDGTISSNPNALYVLDGDVYVVGYGINNGKNVAKLWKNGVATNLSDGTSNSEANAVYVVKQ